MLWNLNPAAVLAAMQGLGQVPAKPGLPPGLIKGVRIVAGAPKAARAAKRDGPFQDVNGRWHWAHGRMMSRVDAQGLGLSWPEPVKAPKAARAAKRDGPFQDVRGRWHWAHGPFMAKADVARYLALGAQSLAA